MLWKILIWGLFSYYCGGFLDALFEPTYPIVIKACYIVPFILIGFMYNYRRSKYSWFRLYVFSYKTTHRKLTFWGIPIGKEKQIKDTSLREFIKKHKILLKSPPSNASSIRKLTYTFAVRGKLGGEIVWRAIIGLWFKLTIVTILVILLCAIGIWFSLPNTEQITDIAQHVHLKLFKTFRVTEQTLLKLHQEKIPPHILAKLKNLKQSPIYGQEVSQVQIFRAIAEILGDLSKIKEAWPIFRYKFMQKLLYPVEILVGNWQAFSYRSLVAKHANAKIQFVDAITDIYIPLHGGFKITNLSLTKLREEGIPEKILKELIFFKNKEFMTEYEFLSKITQQIGQNQMVRYKALILKHSPLNNIPENFRKAVVFSEDRRFYSHWGWDWRGKGRAIIHTLLYKISFGLIGSRQGGSTITQQLAKKLFLTDKFSFARKLRESVLAWKLEYYFEKDEILEMYLNKVPFIPEWMAYGIEVASRYYFNKRPKDLNLYESAILVQTIPNPMKNNYCSKREVAKRRAKKLLQSMVTYEFLSEKQFRQAVQTREPKGSCELKRVEIRFLRDWIQSQLQREKLFENIGGRFTVVTTLNTEMQIYAEKATKNKLRKEFPDTDKMPEIGLVALDPDGAVRAIVGSKDYSENTFNHVMLAERQPGSTFKPFVYLAAIEKGWYASDMTAELAYSQNSPVKALARKVGKVHILELAERLGIKNAKQRFISQSESNIALGGGEVQVRLLDLTGAYTTFANGGFAVKPYGIIAVRTNKGNVRYWHRSNVNRVLQKKYVTKINTMLKAVVDYGTGKKANFGEYLIAGKTGTTEAEKTETTRDSRDAWFVGFTPYLCTGVWIGYDDDSMFLSNVSGGGLPAEIFADFMEMTHKFMHFEPLKPLPYHVQ